MVTWRVTLGFALAGAFAAAPTAGTQAAAKTEVLTTKTFKIKPSGKTGRLRLLDVGGVAYVDFAVKRKGRFVRLGKAKIRALADGAKVRALQVDQTGAAYRRNGGQGYYAWDGPDDTTTDDDVAGYFGWGLTGRKLAVY